MALRFDTNVGMELRLRFLEGREVESKFGGIQHMFTAEEGSFYVSDAVGRILSDQIRKLGVRAGEPIEICKREVAANGRKSIQWQVAKVGFAPGEQGDGTFAIGKPEPPSELEKQLAASIQMVQARKQAQTAQAPAWAAVLVEQSNALVDAYAQVLAHASQHSNVRSDDVRSLFLSAFINVSKNGSNRNAA